MLYLLIYLVLGDGGEDVVQVGDVHFFLEKAKINIKVFIEPFKTFKSLLFKPLLNKKNPSY